jgi:hypothetical protein
MADSGVSLPTALSQVDNVAKVQLRGQQTHHPTGPLADELTQSRTTRVERPKPPDPAEKGQVRADERKEGDHRRRRETAVDEPAGAEDGAAAAEPAEGNAPEALGLHVDTKA